MSERGATGSLGRTAEALRTTLGRPDASGVFAVTAVAYLLVYLYAVGDLAPGLGGYALTVAPDPLGALFRPDAGPFSFTPVARVRLGPVTYLLSLDSVFGVGVAALVGLNIALSYLVWTQPRACGIGGPTAGVTASVPAVLSGSACCGPVVLLSLGIQASGTLVTTVQYLLPVGVGALLVSLVLVGRRFEPAAAE